jgi:hypothetical protein
MTANSKPSLSDRPGHMDIEGSHFKGNSNQEIMESQPVEKYACILRRIDSIQATLSRMTAILNSESERGVRS